MAATPIPPILDQDRYVRYEPVALTTDFDVPFPYFGTDASELLVLVDGVKVSAFTVVSRSAGALASAVLPVEDAVVRLGSSVSGVAVEIYGSIRPRRTVQATAAFGTRDFNFVFSYVVATLREMWAQFTRAIQVPPGEAAVTLPVSTERAGKVLGFDPAGNPVAMTPMSGGVVGTQSLLDAAITSPKLADGAVTLAKLADSLLDGTAGALIRWAAGGAYPAGGGAKITGVVAASVVAGATGTTAAAADSSTKLATTAQVQAAIAARSVFAKTFESAPQTFTASGSLTVAHGLGVLPKLVTAEAQVTTAFGIYAVGDRISIASLDWSASGNGSYGAILGYDATNIRVSFGNQPAFGPVPSMTASNVVIILRAFA
jgi:hypothetical protein